MGKTEVIYNDKNPYKRSVTHVAIQTESNPIYVWETYSFPKFLDPPQLGGDMLLLPVKQAMKLFDFKKRKLEGRL